MIQSKDVFSEFPKFQNTPYCSLSIPPLLYMTTKVCRHLGRACRQLANSKVLTECPSYTPTRRGLTTSAPLRPRLRSTRSLPSKRKYHYYTNAEKDHERIITTSMGRIEEFEKASKALSEGSGVQEAIELSKTLKDLGPLKNTWDEYLVLREVCSPGAICSV
jgi:hypothetical protein